MRTTFFLCTTLLCFLLGACDNDPSPVPTPTKPNCIKEIIADFPNQRIFSQEISTGGSHYWINNGANILDGDEPILDHNCEEVCYKGGWINPPCYDQYDEEKWVQINP